MNFFENMYITAMHWTHQIALCDQPCHRGLTVNIIVSPNMVCMVNHLQLRMLYFSKYCLLRYHVKMERARERGKIQMAKGTIKSAKRETQKSNSNPGCQGGENIVSVNCRIIIYNKYKLWFYNLCKTIIVVISYVEVFRIWPQWSIHAYTIKHLDGIPWITGYS